MISLRILIRSVNAKATALWSGPVCPPRSPLVQFTRNVSQSFWFSRRTDPLTVEGEDSHQTEEEIYHSLRPDLDKNLKFHRKYLHELCTHGHLETAETWLQKVIAHKKTAEKAELQFLFEKVVYGCYVRGETQRVLALYSLMEEHDVELNEGLYSILIGVKCNNANTWRNGLDLYHEMISKGIDPHAREYLPLITAASGTGDLQTAWNLLQKLYNYPLLCDDRLMAALTAFIKLLTNSTDKDWIDKVTFFAQFLHNNNFTLADELLEALEELFQRSSGNTWIARFTSAEFTNGSLKCTCCGRFLDKAHVTTKDDEILHQRWVQRMEDLILDVDPRPEGKKLNSILLGKLKQLMKEKGPFDVVLDALNIGYMACGNSFNMGRIQEVVHYYLKLKKTVLVIGAGPMKYSYLTHPHRANSAFKRSIRKSILQLMSTPFVSCFLLRQSFFDDYFIIYAAASSGPNSILVSNDKYTNHLSTIDKNQRNNMQGWLDTHVATCSYSDKGELRIKDPSMIVHKVVFGNDMFHFPSADETKWLCVLKNAESDHKVIT